MTGCLFFVWYVIGNLCSKFSTCVVGMENKNNFADGYNHHLRVESEGDRSYRFVQRWWP